jgi:hypothetical protein
MENRITLPSFAHFLRLFARLVGVIGAVTALTVIDFGFFTSIPQLLLSHSLYSF